MTLFNQDCFDGFQKIKPKSIDLILTDLPYGTTACKWDSILPLDKLWEQLKLIAKPKTAFVFTASQPFTTTIIQSNLKWFRYEWIWIKNQGTNPLTSKIMPMKKHENIEVFYSQLPIYNPQMTFGKSYGGFSSETSKIGEVFGGRKSQHRNNPEGSRYPTTILEFSQERGLHPTQKPVALMEYLIKTYSNPGNYVLDCCMGSGTTGVACVNTGREFIGIEKDKKYFKIAQERIKQAIEEKSSGDMMEKFMK
jgi:site-specific DNA-methyltransferase (adenine-specific)